MLLNSTLQQAPAYPSQPYHTVESLLDDVSQEMASSNLARRHSRGANGPRIPGGSMRIVKPNSTSNSPRGISVISRRKTLMGGGPYRSSRPMAAERNNSPSASSNGGLQVPTRSSRPVSWHPSTPMQQQFICPGSGIAMSNGHGAYEMPMTPAVYSGYTSPVSSFSSLPYTQFDQYPFPTDTIHFSSLDQNNVYSPYVSSVMGQQELAPEQYENRTAEDPSMYTHFDWNDFALNGFNNTTTPPTPENFLPIQHPDSSFEVEGAIPYQALDDIDDGEELIGMGLYDTPDKTPLCDPQLDTYKTLLMQHTTNSSYRRIETPREATGKGLKLEETWIPPPATEEEEEEEEDEDDDDDENDAHGSPVEETPMDDDSILAKFAGISQYSSSSWQNMI